MSCRLAVSDACVALPNFYNVTVRIANVAARLADERLGEKKVRRHMMKARKRKGFGWTRWNRQWLYKTLKLFNGYKVKRLQPKVAPAR